MAKYICIRACVWHKPDFATPRYLEPDGGKTVYELKEGAPPHIFRRVDLPLPAVQPAAQVSPEALGMAMRSPKVMFLELSTKDREELEKIARMVELEDTSQYPDQVSLVKAIMRQAGYIEGSTPVPAQQPAPSSTSDLVLGTPEAEKELAREDQPTIPPQPVDAEELEMQKALEERAKEPKPEPAGEDEGLQAGSTEVELLNKTRKELLEIAKRYNVADAEKAPNKRDLVTAILKAAGYTSASEGPAGA